MRNYQIFLTTIFLASNLAMADVLTWNNCLSITSANNQALIIAREKLNQADAAYRSTLSGWYPQINASLGQQRSNRQTVDPKTDQTSDSVSYGLSAKQLIYDGGKTPANIDASVSEKKAAEYAYWVVESNTRLSLRTAFVQLLQAQEQKTLAESIAIRRKQNLEMIKLRYTAGREHRGSLLVAEANLAQAEADIAQAIRAIDVAQYHVARYLGIAPNTNLIVTESVVENKIITKPDFENIAKQSPVLQEVSTKLESAKYGLASVQADQLPQVYASYQYGKSGEKWLPEDSSWSAGVNVGFTIFDGNQNGTAVEKAQSNINQAQASLIDSHYSVVDTLAQTWNDLQNAQDDLTVSKKFLEAAEERAKISAAQYSTGLLTFDSWTIIEDNLVSARKSFLNAQINVLLAEARWTQAQGGGL